MSGNCIGERSDPKLLYKLAYSWEGNPKSPFIPTVVVILVTDLADQAFITHAAPGSKTEAFARKLADSGKPLLTLNSPLTRI